MKTLDGLDVAVDQAAAVDRGERVRELRADSSSRSPRQRPAGDHLVQRPPLEQLADQEGLAVLLARVVDRADVRVADQRGDVRLAAEALDRASRSRQLLRRAAA